MKQEAVEAKIREYMSSMQRHSRAPQKDIKLYVNAQIQMCETILGWMQSEEKPAVQEVTKQVKPEAKTQSDLTSREADVLIAICEDNVEMTFTDDVISRLQGKREQRAISWNPTGKAVGGVLSSLEKKGYISMCPDDLNPKQVMVCGKQKAFDFNKQWVNTH